MAMSSPVPRGCLVFVAIVVALVACKTESPAGTLVGEWTYEAMPGDPQPVPASKHPPQVVTATGELPVTGGAPMKLRFETEIGDLAGTDAHWNWPRHVRITLAEPTRAKFPQVMCMPGPPGNKIDGGVLIHPVGHDAVTPSGMVACFLSGSRVEDNYVFDIDGDGQITRSVPSH